MKVITVPNVHTALPVAVRYLLDHGIRRDSRNGPVIVAPEPVTTVYTRPLERVIFWPERDANPFFHVYEALWMLAGRNDIAPLVRYAKNMAQFSDDGVTQHGAYGHRWRQAFSTFPSNYAPADQLEPIARRLRENPDDRRCVLQMWQSSRDLDSPSKDVPCNTMATFQRDPNGALHLTVFCRSNDIVWGAYGANAVHMSFLLEYMARWIGCDVGTYTQVSVNWHGYLSTLEGVKTLGSTIDFRGNPYTMDGGVKHVLMPNGSIADLDRTIAHLLKAADEGDTAEGAVESEWEGVMNTLLSAHHLYRTLPAPFRYTEAIDLLNGVEDSVDWIVAGREWIERRKAAWEAKQ
jgi:hypothetical protein